MNKDKNVNKKVLKKFLNLLDKGMDMETCLAQFPDQREDLKHYAAIIGNFENLKNIRVDRDFENNSLKDIYLRARIENIKNREKISKKDAFLIRLRPAYLKPLVIFLGILIFMSFSFAGTLYASESSIPGNTLYSLKRTSENIHVAFTPYKYEKGLYLKLLDTRLSEADSILSKTNYTDTVAAEKLLSDIDITYKKCQERKYLGADQDGHMQIRIRGIEEGFRYRYGMQKGSTTNCPNQTYEDEQNTKSSSDTAKTGQYQNNSGNSDNNKTEDNSSPDTGEQNQMGKQNQYGK